MAHPTRGPVLRTVERFTPATLTAVGLVAAIVIPFLIHPIFGLVVLLLMVGAALGRTG